MGWERRGSGVGKVWERCGKADMKRDALWEHKIRVHRLFTGGERLKRIRELVEDEGGANKAAEVQVSEWGGGCGFVWGVGD